MNPEFLNGPTTERNDDASSRTLLRVLIALAIFAGTFFAVMLAARTVCFFMPRQYYARVIIEAKPDDYILCSIFDDPMQRSALQYSPHVVTLASKGIIYPVIDRLNLTDAWRARCGGSPLTKEDIYHVLVTSIEVSPIRNSDLIQIGVYSPDRQEAVQIANMIAAVYSEVRKNDQMQLGQALLAMLKDEVANRRKVVEVAQEELRKIRERDSNPAENPEMHWPVTDDEKQYNDAKSKCMELKLQIKQVEQLKPEELLTLLAKQPYLESPIARILPQLQEANAEESHLLKSGLGEDHPRVKSLRAQKEVLSRQLTAAIEAIRNSLAVRLKVAEETLSALEAKLEASKSAPKPAIPPNEDYPKVKQTYVEAKKLLEAAEARLATQTVQLHLGVPPVKIWEKAEPSLYPAKPNVKVIMPVAAVSGALLGFVFAGIYLFRAFRGRDPSVPRSMYQG